MKRLSILLLFITLTILSFSQVSNYSDVYVQKKFFNELYLPRESDNIEIEGSPYLNDDFSEGRVMIGPTIYIMPIRYNVFFEAFEVDLPEKNTYINSTIADTVYFNNSVFIFKTENKTEKVFEVLSHSEKGDVLKKHIVNFTQGSFGIPFKADVYPNFKKESPKYYYALKDKELINIFSFKDLYNAFPDKKDQLKEEIKKRKFKKNKEADLVGLFKFLVTII